MNDKKKLELIDQMIGNYYEFCSFDDNGMNAGSLQMLIGCIEAVLMQDSEGEEEEEEEGRPRCRHGVDILSCLRDCLCCPLDHGDPFDDDDFCEDDGCCDACNDCGGACVKCEQDGCELSPEAIEAIEEFSDGIRIYAKLLSDIAKELEEER